MPSQLTRRVAARGTAICAITLAACTNGTLAPDDGSFARTCSTDGRAADTPASIAPVSCMRSETGNPLTNGWIYRTGFEPPLYGVGPLSGQDGWLSITHDAAATVTTDGPGKGRQSLHVDGRLLVPIPGQDARGSLNFRNLYYDAQAAGTPVVDVEADVRLDGPRTYGTDPQDDGVSARLVAIGLNPAGVRRRLGFAVISSNGAFHGTADGSRTVVSTPVRLGHTYTVRMRLDFAQRTVEFFLEDRSLGAFPFNDADATVPVLANVRLDVRAENTPFYDGAPYQASFDDLTVRVARPGGSDSDRGTDQS